MGVFGSFRKSSSKAASEPCPGIDAPSRRRCERHPTAVLSCILGQVRDLSITGMRITATAPPPVPPGMLFEMELESPTDSISLVAKLARVERVKGGGYDVGVEFQRMTPELTAAVHSLALHGVVKGRKPARPAPLSARMQLPDLYATLGVPPEATDDQVQRAFRELARQFHPDVNKTPEANLRFVELLKAYDVLKDADKRRAYDAARIKAAA